MIFLNIQISWNVFNYAIWYDNVIEFGQISKHAKLSDDTISCLSFFLFFLLIFLFKIQTYKEHKLKLQWNIQISAMKMHNTIKVIG